jgi:hypothetical protein
VARAIEQVGWIDFSTLSEFAGPLHVVEAQTQ